MKPRGTVLPSFWTALLLAFLPASSASALTNLTPYLPSGWTDKIVVSKVTGTNTDSTSLTATDTLYLDWAVLNNGSTATAVRYHVEIYLDGALITSEYSDPPLNPNFYDYWEDASIGSLPAGTHTIRIKTDSTGVIAESNETDNEYTRTITVTGIGAPNLTPYQPSGWSDKIVVSRVPGTHTDSTSLTATDALYLDLAVTNIGSTATAVRFHTEIYIDGSLLTTGYSDPPLNPNFYSYWEDLSIGSLPAGIHTIRIKTDWNGVIAETNEADNEYTKTVVITGAQACTPGQNQLCLNNNRFKVQVNWRVPAQGISGVGTAIPVSGGDTGYFWFFNSANVELMVKVLDGRGVNGHFWVFYGALSDVEYTLTVTDTTTGLVKSYFNPQGRVASVADTSAFVSSTPQVSSSLLTSPLQVEPHVPEQGRGSALAGRDASATRASRSSGVSSPFASLNPTANAAPCVPSTTALCLNENRFSAKVTWRVPSGASGVGTAVPLTGDTGYFWFFNSANVELVIKVLDGRGINGQFWVFYGALSDVEYAITVTDTDNGSVRTYSNVQGNLTSRADTSAFTGQPAPPSQVTFNAPAELPRAFVGTAYDFSFCDPRPTTGLCGAFPLSRNPTGGNPPYHFQLDSGGGFPPFGLSLNLNGILSGTPSAPGRSSTFRVCAVDLAGSSSCRTTTLDVSSTVTYTLSTSTAGTGSGAISPTGGSYASGTVVTLSATPNTGSTFSGWSGACTGTLTPCMVTMNANKSVTATFNSTGSSATITANPGSVSMTASSCYPSNCTVSRTIIITSSTPWTSSPPGFGNLGEGFVVAPNLGPAGSTSVTISYTSSIPSRANGFIRFRTTTSGVYVEVPVIVIVN